ncbi:MAG: hypothetical protein LH614_07505 [Pyrinomonadaceae bacterium]|nr:hypothetical protein [Pyrinomonadaceae bacterium]
MVKNSLKPRFGISNQKTAAIRARTEASVVRTGARAAKTDDHPRFYFQFTPTEALAGASAKRTARSG